MENNIFIKMKKDKYNPDIENKLNQKQNERDNSKFILSNNFYNPITGNIPKVINNVNDLVLEKDNSLHRNDIQKLIIEKENERNMQDNTYKPIKTKIVNEMPDRTEQVVRTNYIETFEDLKRGSTNIIKPVIDKNYDNILVGLKELGIIK